MTRVWWGSVCSLKEGCSHSFAQSCALWACAHKAACKVFQGEKKREIEPETSGGCSRSVCTCN